MLSFGATVVAAFLAVALFGPFLTDPSGREISRHRLVPPGWAHPFGTDHLGRDGLAMFVEGARVSILVGVVATVFSFMVGVVMGAVAGYVGGWVDHVVMRFTEIAMVIPRFFLAVIVVSFLGRSLLWVILVIGGLGWMVIAQITRVQFLSLRTREFVEASRAHGARTSRIIVRTILPNALPTVMTYTALQVAVAMLLEAYLSFLGMGDPGFGSWGLQLRFAQDHLASWWMAVFPGLGLLLVVLGTNLLGEGLNELSDPMRTARRFTLPPG
ncbi:MAG: ABC transporter permease [Actinobacteria bacterium]|nr:ABC transporter permease [Actinomycetota bacterium]